MSLLVRLKRFAAPRPPKTARPPLPGSLGAAWAEDLPTAAELERATQAQLLAFLLVFALLVSAALTFVFAIQGEHALAAQCAPIGVVSMACALWARRRGWTRAPMALVSVTLVAVLAWLTLQQGPSLPAAAWWLAVMPLILATAGLYALAIATVAVFIGIVSALQVGLAPESLGLARWALVAPWRHGVAVVGSEFIALGLILISMRRRHAATLALEHARSTAIQALKVKSRFLATMSHEIRTPLNGVIATAEMLKSPALDEVQRVQLLALQADSARSLLALVNDVLDWSKLEAGRAAIEAQPLNLRRIVAEGNELFAVQAHAKGIELTSSCDPDVPRSAIGDATRLRQIVNNLVGNAVKFTATGGVHIHLSMEAAEAAHAQAGTRRVRIEVADSGIGIEARQLSTLFDAFSQADDAVRYGGTGLGLTISRELAQRMGGSIDVASMPGRGSTFTLTVPLEFRPDRESRSRRIPRRDVVLASASPGVQRHLKTALHDLGIEPVITAELPTASGRPMTAMGRLLLSDAPLLVDTAEPRAWLDAQLAAGARVAVVTPIGADVRLDLPDNVLRLYKPVRLRALKAVVEALDGCPSEWAVKREFLPSAPAAGPHVLIAEDNPVNQVLVQAMLGELGATSVVAANGREALLCLAAERFDLVLMDMRMPELDGLAAARAWRIAESATRGRRLPIVAMTANAPDQDAANCRAAGMDAFLAKPFGMVELRQVLETWTHSGAATPFHNLPAQGSRT